MNFSKGFPGRFRPTLVVVPVICLVVLALGCNNPAANADYIPTGNLTVNVNDQSGAAVAGAAVDVLDGQANFIWAHGLSGSDGLVVFSSPSPTTTAGLLGGSYRVSLTAPTGYVVPSTQANPVMVQINDKKTTMLTMRVAKGP